MVHASAVEKIKESIRDFVSLKMEELQELEKGMSEIEQYGRLLFLQKLQEKVGILRSDTEVFSKESLKEKLGIIPKYDRLYIALLDMMEREGWIEQSGERIHVLPLATSFADGERVNLEEKKKEITTYYQELRPFISLLDTVVCVYPEILSGEKTHFEVLFPHGTGEIYENVFRGNPLSDFYNRLVTISIIVYVEALLQLDPNRRINVIEIGSGIGGTSEMAMEALKPYRMNIEFYYTDISLAFTNHGKKKFGSKYPFARFQRLDIEMEPVKQGFEARSFDIVFETNAIHATRKLDSTMKNIKQLLKKEGLLVINEMSQAQDFGLLASGIIDGWWRFEDEHKRLTHSPLLSYSQWIDLFLQHGFRSINGAEPERKKKYEQAIIFALSDGELDLEPRLEAPQSGTLEQAIELLASTGNSIREDLKKMVCQITGVPLDDVTDFINLFSLGIDSLMMVQLRQQIIHTYSVDIPTNTFYIELHNVDAIAKYIEKSFQDRDHNRSGQGFQAFFEAQSVHDPLGKHDNQSEYRAQSMYKEEGVQESGSSSSKGIKDIIQRQLNIMEGQLRLLKTSASESSHAQTIVRESRGQASASSDVAESKIKLNSSKATLISSNKTPTYSTVTLNKAQKEFIDRFILRWTTRTKRSKEYAAKHRAGLADWIANLNYDQNIKEMVYPIVSKGSKGSVIWDIDGNEYIDASMGYGVSFFGHQPDFIIKAIHDQLKKGIELGPQSEIAGEVSELIKSLTGVERVTYCNTGTEAVMAALRIARAVTRRDKVVRFTNSYHGTFDGILAEVYGDTSQPMAIGTPLSMVQDTIVQSYGSRESLEAIKRYRNEIAAVLVEPVQSRNPGLHPREYLQELRELCTEHDIALIFDEMVTGFRIHPGGAQAYFGVTADIVTYGKIVGGGMPIGIVAGKSKYLDAIDGGSWSFGDDSAPEVQPITFGGTFCKHPLTMAACRAVLQFIKAEGISVIHQTNERTRYFIERANAYFREAEVPLKAVHFGSLYRFLPGVSTDQSMLSFEIDLFYRLVMEAGVYMWERRTCVFSTAHSDEDAEKILDALRHGVEAIRSGGFDFRSLHDSDPTRSRHIHNRASDHRASTCGEAYSPMSHAPSTQPLSLSSEERRVYIMSTLEGGNEAYQIPCKYSLSGPVSFDKLKQSFQIIADTHEMLRCSYHLNGSTVERRIAETVAPNYINVDLRKEGAEEEFKMFWDQPFDLKQTPLWRWALVVNQQGQQQLYFNIHHIIADGGSLNVIFQDLEKLFLEGNILSPTLPFGEFVKEEQSFLHSTEAIKQKEWWLQQLNPLPPVLNLPSDTARPVVNQFRGDIRYFTLSMEVISQVKALARQSETTPFMVLLAAWGAFLGRVADQDDFCIGVPWDRRNRGNFNRTVGMFAQSLVIRVRPNGSQPFIHFLNAVKDMCLGAYGHPDYPIDELLEDLKVTRNVSRNPLFDVMFNYENEEQRIVNLGGVHAELDEYASQYSQFDLFMEILERKDSLFCSLIYAVPLFSKKRIDDWIERFQLFLNEVIMNPEQKIADIELLKEEEKEEVLTIGRGPTLNEAGKTVSKLLAETFKVHSEQPAIWFRGEEMSYAALNERASILAQRLTESGLQSGSKLGILLPRTPDMLSALLAALKLGCSWVPLDPSYPKERIRYMIESSEIDLLVSESEIYEQYEFAVPYIDPNYVCVNETTIELEWKHDSHPNDLAYVIYTSGSSGRPKGVQIEQGSLANFISGMANAVDWSTGARTACLTTVSFDIFLLETLLCLVYGGCIVLAEEATGIDPEGVAELVREGRVECLQMTPTRLQVLCTNEKAANEALSLIRTLIVGGETFPVHLLPFLKRHKSLRIFNVYGPTETCIWSTCKEMTHTDHVSIGLPITNTNVYVLDKNKRLVPPGVVGSLWIGGAGVARGYVNQQDHNSERFTDDPFFGGRMYGTGDLARWNYGELEYLGREDEQVKIQGYRIELGEIERVLREHPAITNAVTSVWEASPGNKMLVSYYEKHSDMVVTETELKNWLAERLPKQMIPAVVSEIFTLPTTQNGKIDRKSLPYPKVYEADQRSIEKHHEELDLILIDVWKKILGDRSIGLHDSFFDVGGNSFSLILLHAELDKIYPGAVSVADLFVHHTISKLSQYIEHVRSQEELEDHYSLTLSDPWFDSSNHQDGRVGMTIERSLISATERLGASFNLDLSHTMLALFALYMHKSLGENHIPIFKLGHGDKVAAVPFDFSKSSDLSNVFKDLFGTLPAHSEYKNMRTLRAIKSSPLDARIGFGVGGDYNRRQLLKGLDLYLLVEQMSGKVKLTLDFRKGFSVSALKNHLHRFGKLIELVVEKATSEYV